MAGEHGQMSESLLVGTLLALAGGFMAFLLAKTLVGNKLLPIHGMEMGDDLYYGAHGRRLLPHRQGRPAVCGSLPGQLFGQKARGVAAPGLYDLLGRTCCHEPATCAAAFGS